MNNFPKNPEKAILYLLAGVGLYALLFLGGVHLFDWDEVNFAECAREMLITGDYLRVYIGFLPFWEKPPFFIWEQALAMQAFGVNEFAARLPNAITGVLTLWVLYLVGKQQKNSRFGFWVALCFVGSFLPALYMKSGIIDPVFNLWIFLGIVFLYNARQNQETRKKLTSVALAGLFTGLAVLTKGPAALLITGLVWGVYWVWNRSKLPLPLWQIALYFILALAVPGIWFGIETIKHGPWFFQTFIEYQIRLFSTPDAGHGGFLGYHFVVLLLGCFPVSLLVIARLLDYKKFKGNTSPFSFLMIALFWVVLILFSIVKSKIVHYSSLCYFPMAWLAAEWLEKTLDGSSQTPKWLKTSIWFLGFILSLPPLLFYLLIQNKTGIIPYIKDAFAQANLQVDVHFTGIEWTISLFYVGVLVLFYNLLKSNIAKAWAAFFVGTVAYLFLIMVGFIGRVEQISQNAVIEWQKSLRGKDVYVITYNYKSYAHLFYQDLQPQNAILEQDSLDWRVTFLKKNHRKDIYIFVQNTEEEPLRNNRKLKRLQEKNGFVMYLKPAYNENNHLNAPRPGARRIEHRHRLR